MGESSYHAEYQGLFRHFSFGSSSSQNTRRNPNFDILQSECWLRVESQSFTVRTLVRTRVSRDIEANKTVSIILVSHCTGRWEAQINPTSALCERDSTIQLAAFAAERLLRATDHKMASPTPMKTRDTAVKRLPIPCPTCRDSQFAPLKSRSKETGSCETSHCGVGLIRKNINSSSRHKLLFPRNTRIQPIEAQLGSLGTTNRDCYTERQLKDDIFFFLRDQATRMETHIRT